MTGKSDREGDIWVQLPPCTEARIHQVSMLRTQLNVRLNPYSIREWIPKLQQIVEAAGAEQLQSEQDRIRALLPPGMRLEDVPPWDDPDFDWTQAEGLSCLWYWGSHGCDLVRGHGGTVHVCGPDFHRKVRNPEAVEDAYCDACPVDDPRLFQ